LFKIKVIGEDESTYYTHKLVKIKNKRFETPIKAVNLNYFYPNIPVAHNTFVEEIYKSFDNEILNNLSNDSKYGEYKEKFNHNLKRVLNNSSHENPLIFLPALNTFKLSDDGLMYLVLTQRYSDFYVVPTLQRARSLITEQGDAGVFNKYYIPLVKKYLKNAYEMNIEKTVMGSIPVTLPISQIRKLLNIYLENDVTSFLIDLQGRVPFTVFQELTLIQEILQKYSKNNDEDTFIHATNVNVGRMSKKRNEILAYDALSFGLGIDSIGDNHLGGGGGRQEFRLRLFSKDEYAYCRVEEGSNFEDIYPNDSKVPMDYFINESRDYKKIKAQKMINYEQMGIETRNIIKEIDSQTVAEYIKEKPMVMRDSNKVKLLFSAKSESNTQKNIEDFLKGLK